MLHKFFLQPLKPFRTAELPQTTYPLARPSPAPLTEKNPGDDEELTHRSVFPVEDRVSAEAEVPPAVVALEQKYMDKFYLTLSNLISLHNRTLLFY
ncbi:hypothetical protein AKJ40_02775 [candidate division MSBL1 archaeon SCGC-AAA259M10]|uniref:Uncharacterized protein n=1 Tax=candidate division MSBL1 archaeon SCGC-AAA259M10 TaxID=1698270 RepID=A0A133UZI6_9EURY|nr:hypothetical protein AKJ40_02775 [candidate division MSBL1 archaeon SCGC-AAA259M10]